MRDLKFRAWDESRQRYFTSPNWVEFNVNKYGVLLARNIERGGGYVDLITEQFTGLLDKNGKEIYEGDVLSINVGGGEVYTAPVRFSEEGFWGVDVYAATQVSNPYKWKYKHDKIKSHGFRLNMVEPLTSLQCLVYEAPNTRKDWQVIGNIHEDKHLLEQRKGE